MITLLLSETFQNFAFVGPGRADLDQLPERKAELARDLADLRLLGPGDRVVRRGDGEEAVQELPALLARGDLLELAGHEEALGAAGQPVLGLGDLYREHRLFHRQIAQALEDLLHAVRLLFGDVEVGVRNASEDEGEGGDVAGPFGREGFELTDDLADRLRVARLLPGCAPPESEEVEDRHGA